MEEPCAKRRQGRSRPVRRQVPRQGWPTSGALVSEVGVASALCADDFEPQARLYRWGEAAEPARAFAAMKFNYQVRWSWESRPAWCWRARPGANPLWNILA